MSIVSNKTTIYNFKGLLMKNWFIGRNRYSRLEWWIYFILAATLSNPFLFVYIVFKFIYQPPILVFFLILDFVLTWRYFVVSIGRFHDINRLGWNVLWSIIPPGIFYVIAVCGFLKGIEGENKYGLPPPIYRNLTDHEKIT